nr:MAG TPA: hypothetical protein [Caudoviricetes sp.]
MSCGGLFFVLRPECRHAGPERSPHENPVQICNRNRDH